MVMVRVMHYLCESPHKKGACMVGCLCACLYVFECMNVIYRINEQLNPPWLSSNRPLIHTCVFSLPVSETISCTLYSALIRVNAIL